MASVSWLGMAFVFECYLKLYIRVSINESIAEIFVHVEDISDGYVFICMYL